MDILNSDWTITVVGGIISTVVGTLIANGIQNSRGSRRNSMTVSDLFDEYNTFQVIALFATMAAAESMWLGFCLNTLFPLFADSSSGFGNEFGSAFAFFIWLAMAAGIPSIFLEILSGKNRY